MEDFSTAASAWGWISTWEQKNGRIFGAGSKYCDAINKAVGSINNAFSSSTSMDQYGSICVRDRVALTTNPAEKIVAVCKTYNCLAGDTSCSLTDQLVQDIKNNEIDVMAFNNVMENPTYSIGQLTQLSSAFYSLNFAGAPQGFSKMIDSDKFKMLLGQELLHTAQERTKQTSDLHWEFKTIDDTNNCWDWQCSEQGCSQNQHCWDNQKKEAGYPFDTGCIGYEDDNPFCILGERHSTPSMYPVMEFMKDKLILKRERLTFRYFR